MYLGLDLSLTATGLAVVEENGNIVLSKVLSTPKKKIEGMERYSLIRQEVIDVVKAHNIKKVFIEGYSFGSRGRSIFNLGELGGIIRITLSDLGVPYEEIPPKVVKKFVCGSGNADKLDMMNSIKEKYKYVFDDDNKADAYGIAVTGLGVESYDSHGNTKKRAI